MSDDDKPDLPTVQDTEGATGDIANGRNKAATLALTTLAREVIEVIRRVDTTHNVGAYIKSLTIEADGPGVFRLKIDDRDSGVDAEMLEALLAADLLPNDYHKPLRPVMLREDD